MKKEKGRKKKERKKKINNWRVKKGTSKKIIFEKKGGDTDPCRFKSSTSL